MALAVPRDRDHARARAELEHVRPGEALLTSDYVFDETVTRLRKRIGHDVAVAVGDAIRTSTIARLVDVEPSDVDRAWELFRKYRDKELSFTDCTTFVLAQRLRARAIFAFDDDFVKLGLRVVPG